MATFFKAKTKKHTVNKNNSEPVPLHIQRLNTEGCGVAKIKNVPVFVEGTLPNEQVTARIIEQKNKFFKAKLSTIEKPSEYRVEAKCKHFLLCGGCDLQHLAFEQHLAFKRTKVEELFARESFYNETPIKKADNNKKYTVILPWQKPIVSDAWYYRRKARIGVQFNKQGQATVGFRQKASNQLVAVKQCPVLVEPLADIFPLLKKIIAQLTLSKSIGHIEVIATEVTTIIIRQLKTMNKADEQLWLTYAEKYNWQLVVDNGENKLCLINQADKTSDANQTQAITLQYPLTNDVVISFSTDDFIQINHQVNLKMVEQAINWMTLKPTDKVLDLFCGLGNFSLAIAKQSCSVVGIEGVQAMVDKAQLNAKNNAIDNCHFYQADLNSEWLSEPWVPSETCFMFDKVLLDPARAGAENAVKQVAQLNVPTILYVSCDPATLTRDAKWLVEHGYRIEKIGLIEMFAQTKHVETMVLFQQIDG